MMGSVAEFHCDEDFYRDGVKSVICLPNGEWSHEAPTCEPLESIQCQGNTNVCNPACDANAYCGTDGGTDCTCNAGYNGDGRTAGTGCTVVYAENVCNPACDANAYC